MADSPDPSFRLADCSVGYDAYRHKSLQRHDAYRQLLQKSSSPRCTSTVKRNASVLGAFVLLTGFALWLSLARPAAGEVPITGSLPHVSYIVLLVSAFVGAAVSSFAGFAFSPVAGIGLLYFFPHDRVIPLLMLCSVAVQVTTLLYLRRNIVWKNIGPMLAGGALGVSLSVFLFQGIDASTFQVGFGLFLAIYSTLMLWRPASKFACASTRTQETAVGFAGGVVGGFTAMPGAIPLIYCDLRGIPKELQRATVQSFILAMQVLAIGLFAFSGDINGEVLRDLASALPALGAGVAIGLVLFGRVPDVRFRQVVLLMLLFTGVAMMRPATPVGAVPLTSPAQTEGRGWR